VTLGGDVIIKGYEYRHGIIDKDVNGIGRDDLDDKAALGAAFRPVEIEVREGATIDEARAGRPLSVRQAPAYVEATRLQGPNFEAKVTLTSPGLNYLWTFAINQDGELVRPQTFVYNVQSTSVAQPVDETPEPVTAPEVATPAPETVTGPVPPGETTPAPSASQPSPSPAPAAGAVARPSADAPAATTAPSARPASSPAVSTGAGPALPGPAAPAVAAADDVSPSPAPRTTDLWSGLDPAGQAPSLLDGSGTPAPSNGSPIGAGLLGIGVLAMAGVAAVAGKRKLALARRPR